MQKRVLTVTLPDVAVDVVENVRDRYCVDVTISGLTIPGIWMHRRRNGWYLSAPRVGSRDGQPLRVAFEPGLNAAIAKAIVEAITRLECGRGAA